MRTSIAVLCLTMLAACGEKPPAAPAPAVAAPAASGGGAVTSPAELAKILPGKWRSVDDEKSTVIITASGEWTSEYLGAPPTQMKSTWKLFNAADAPTEAKQYPLEAGKTYLEVKDSSAGPLYYEVGDVGPEMIEFFYLARGNRQAFVPLK